MPFPACARVIAEAMPDADQLVPDYAAGLFSQADPFLIAESLVRSIADAVEAKKKGGSPPYHDIILVGHSLGALLVRKAFVWASGQNRIIRAREIYAPSIKSGQHWSAELYYWLAPIGVGPCDVRQRNVPDDVAGVPYGRDPWRWLRLGRLINAVREGTPFVANLRIQWIKLARETSPDYDPTARNNR